MTSPEEFLNYEKDLITEDLIDSKLSQGWQYFTINGSTCFVPNKEYLKQCHSYITKDNILFAKEIIN